jgi:hypothetical protein
MNGCYPNVLLVISHDHFPLIKAFNIYANVFSYFIDPQAFTNIIHRVPGRIKADHGSFPSSILSLSSKILNRSHKIRIKQVKPEEIDLVFVSDPVVCRINLKEFKNSVKTYWSHDSVYGSTFYTQVLGMQIQDYDMVFCAHRQHLEYFKEFGVKTHWLPFAYDPTICKPIDIPEKYNVAFVGTLTEKRRNLIAKMEKFPYLQIFYGAIFQHDMAYMYNRSDCT